LDIAITPEDAAGPPAGRWPFWRTAGWGAVVIVVSQLVQAFALVIVAAIDKFYLYPALRLSTSFVQVLLADAAEGDVLAGIVIVSDLAAIAAILLIVWVKRVPPLDYLALGPVRAPVLLKWTGIMIAYVALTSGAASLFHVDFGGAVMGNMLGDSRYKFLFWIAVVLAAPAFEEGLFRGLLFRGFEASFLKTCGTIVLTAILWAALHVQYNLYGIAFIAGVGILFGIARAQTGSLTVTLVLHAVMNFGETLVYTLWGDVGP
jgi:membrane protease YdiL (CAAX protease family)